MVYLSPLKYVITGARLLPGSSWWVPIRMNSLKNSQNSLSNFMLNSEPVSTVEGKWCGNICCVEYFGLRLSWVLVLTDLLRFCISWPLKKWPFLWIVFVEIGKNHIICRKCPFYFILPSIIHRVFCSPDCLVWWRGFFWFMNHLRQCKESWTRVLIHFASSWVLQTLKLPSAFFHVCMFFSAGMNFCWVD